MVKFILVVAAMVMLIVNPVMAGGVAAETGLHEVEINGVWPEKKAWVGQTAVFYMPKIHEKATFLSIYRDPDQPITGIEQKFLAQKIANRPFVIKGLYYKKTKQDEYYWLLAAPSGETAVWVRDYNSKAADLPFSLPAEIKEELKAKDDVRQLVGKFVWYNMNMAVFKEAAGHLEALQIEDIASEGPYSDSYLFTFKNKADDKLQWKTGYAGTPPVYGHTSLLRTLKECFYLEDPIAAKPDWTSEDWAAITKREIRRGWSQEKLLMSWGRPEKIESTGDNAKEVRWFYEDTALVVLKQGVIAKILIPKEGNTAGTEKQAKKKRSSQAGKKAFSDYQEVDERTKKDAKKQ
jgi:hypothetical protein